MEIKDYLHFYIGQDFFYTIEGHEPKRMKLTGDQLACFYTLADDPEVNYKLILRKLSDMTEEDGLAIFGSETKYLLYKKEARELGADLWLFTANEYTRLLKDGFDCHDLIPNGLAIDSKSL